MPTFKTTHSRWRRYNSTPGAHQRRQRAREAESIAGPAPAYTVTARKIKQRPDERTVTDWFTAAQPPVRNGVYQLQLSAGWNIISAQFSGGRWTLLPGPFGGPSALHIRRWPGFRWRGLSAPSGA